MAENDNIKDVCDSDFESDFVSSHVLKSFDADIDQITSIAFSNLEDLDIALISTNYSTCRNLHCAKSGERTPFLIQNIQGYCCHENGKIESGVIMFAGFNQLTRFMLARDDNQYDFSIPIRLLPTTVYGDEFFAITGFCSISNNGDLAACLVDSSSYDLAKDSRRIVRIIDGQDSSPFNRMYMNDECRDIEFDGEERLFTYPRRIALSSRDDFWVVNRTGEQSGDVTVVGMADGKLKFRYNRRVSNIPFDPKDVARNIKETMVIADFRNHAIHLVKDDGTFLQYIMTSEHGLSFPTTVVIDRYDRAWIGCDFGKVHIVRFNKKFE